MALPRGTDGRIRLETLDNQFSGDFSGSPLSQGKPFGLFLPPNPPASVQGCQILEVQSGYGDRFHSQSVFASYCHDRSPLHSARHSYSIGVFSGKRPESDHHHDTAGRDIPALAGIGVGRVPASGTTHSQVRATWKLPPPRYTIAMNSDNRRRFFGQLFALAGASTAKGADAPDNTDPRQRAARQIRESTALAQSLQPVAKHLSQRRRSVRPAVYRELHEGVAAYAAR